MCLLHDSHDHEELEECAHAAVPRTASPAEADHLHHLGPVPPPQAQVCLHLWGRSCAKWHRVHFQSLEKAQTWRDIQGYSAAATVAFRWVQALNIDINFFFWAWSTTEHLHYGVWFLCHSHHCCPPPRRMLQIQMDVWSQHQIFEAHQVTESRWPCWWGWCHSPWNVGWQSLLRQHSKKSHSPAKAGTLAPPVMLWQAQDKSTSLIWTEQHITTPMATNYFLCVHLWKYRQYNIISCI